MCDLVSAIPHARGRGGVLTDAGLRRRDTRASMPDTKASASTESREETSAFSRPSAVGDVEHAQMWYYMDQQGEQQGPCGVDMMRSWFQSGFFPASTQVSPSFYGEVHNTPPQPVSSRSAMRLRHPFNQCSDPHTSKSSVSSPAVFPSF